MKEEWGEIKIEPGWFKDKIKIYKEGIEERPQDDNVLGEVIDILVEHDKNIELVIKYIQDANKTSGMHMELLNFHRDDIKRLESRIEDLDKKVIALEKILNRDYHG